MLIYLASPYSHPDRAVRQERFEKVCIKAAEIMNEGYKVFCPIAHTHPLTEYTNILNQKDGDWWLKQDFSILQHCDVVCVLKLPGWKRSYGISRETEYAIEAKIPVVYITYGSKFDITHPLSNIYSPKSIRSIERAGRTTGDLARNGFKVL